jgi:uncharacterized protein
MNALNSKTKKELWTFLIITLVLSSLYDYLIISSGSLQSKGGLYSLGLMWSPAIAALITNIIYQGNLRGMGWGWGKTRYQLISYFLPILYATPAYGFVWLVGLGGFNQNIQPNWAQFLIAGNIASLISAMGEEIGWRGFLVPKLASLTTFSRTALFSGLIWAVWHFPILLFADYNAGTPWWYSLTCFTVMVVSISVILAWLRLKSGSLWTGVLFHASHNLYIQGFFDPMTIDKGITRFFTTEFGASLAITTLIIAFVFWRFRHYLPNAQGTEPDPGSIYLSTPTP